MSLLIVLFLILDVFFLFFFVNNGGSFKIKTTALRSCSISAATNSDSKLYMKQLALKK